MPTKNEQLNIVHNFKSDVDDTLNAQDEYATYVRRSYMYEFILIVIIAIIVLVITIRNMTSDTVTTAGYAFCWIILMGFVIALVIYMVDLTQGGGSKMVNSGSSGPVIRIHYV